MNFKLEFILLRIVFSASLFDLRLLALGYSSIYSEPLFVITSLAVVVVVDNVSAL